MRLHSIFNFLALAAPIFATVLPSYDYSQRSEEVSAQHLESRQSNAGSIPVTFNLLAQTGWGESIQVAGSTDELGNWAAANAVALTAAQYTAGNPLWSITVDLPVGQSFSYKFIRISVDGTVIWEDDPDRFYTVPGNGATAATISNSWQARPTTSATRTATSTAPIASSTCTNGPTSRGCWTSPFSINTDFDQNWPITGRTVSYNFDITNITLAPDGFARPVFAVNGQYPGPTIFANWGDTIQVTVQNSLQHNGTSIHWHGMRMYHANGQDGVPGVTECPIAPGRSKTYTLLATQYGTSWYHSHFSSQYGDGILGPIVINGPASANYDIDLGALPMTDWYYPTVMTTAARAMHANALAPTADNGLINGTMVSTSGNRGAYAKTTLTAGKKHRLRFINTSVDNHFMVGLDGHIMTVISADFVPVEPYNASWIFIGIGQRYDVVISADQTPGRYWFRAEVQDSAGCGANFQNGNIRSIFSYSSLPSNTPTLPTSSPTPYTQRCSDETSLTPVWNSYVPRGRIPDASSFSELSIAINQSTAADGKLTLYWQVNGTPLRADWEKPSVMTVRDGETFPKASNMITFDDDDEDEWTYILITTGQGSPFNVNIPHPIHLHGHDFYVLGTGTSAWRDADRQGLNYEDPVRRDVAMLPSEGWLAIAWRRDNPGVWLVHCHIAWHADEGFAVQFLESPDKMLDVAPLPGDFDDQCAAWSDFYQDGLYKQSDSGV
ncbi:unnamed protein product [Zymoseptoria tritici ST99CH_3D1]|nr:unnamed protein product [Zymoseptoria tritici ST99CH_3D1]